MNAKEIREEAKRLGVYLSGCVERDEMVAKLEAAHPGAGAAFSENLNAPKGVEWECEHSLGAGCSGKVHMHVTKVYVALTLPICRSHPYYYAS